MKIRRILTLSGCLVLLFVIVASSLVTFYKNHSQKEYLKRLFANAVYENADPQLQKKIAAVYGERIGVNFPDSTEIIFANAGKGDLLDSTYCASLKMKIDSKDRHQLETHTGGAIMADGEI